MSSLSALDAFPKVNEDFFKKTMSGGVITLVASFLMALLFFSELRLYLAPQTTHELVVDTSRGAHIDINFDVTFPKMPCSWLSLDAMDISGEMHLDVASHDIKKQRLGPGGAPVSTTEVHNVHQTQKKQKDGQNVTCASCYGAESEQYKCCNTCDDVREAYQAKGWVLNNVQNIEQCKDDGYLQMINEQQGEGCHMWGHLSVNKVAGNFHIAAGHSYQSGSMHIHDMAPFNDKVLDFTHKVHSLSFGQPYPGMKNPLDGVMQLVPQKATGSHPGQKAPTGMFQYFLKVVPTDYIDKAGIRTNTNQFSVTENFRESAEPAAGGRSLPGVFFFYDLSPIKVHIQEQRASFLHFLTNVCAIVGGIFAVSGLIDGTVYQAEQVIRKKIELGKHS